MSSFGVTNVTFFKIVFMYFYSIRLKIKGWPSRSNFNVANHLKFFIFTSEDGILKGTLRLDSENFDWMMKP